MSLQEAERRIAKCQAKQNPILNLSGLGLVDLPDEIFSLSHLQGLFLRDNQLTVLPAAISSLSNLETLELSNNQLNTLPNTVSQLTNLAVLYFRGNWCTTVPKVITQLTSLQRLYLIDKIYKRHTMVGCIDKGKYSNKNK